jgi:hypothetical protein
VSANELSLTFLLKLDGSQTSTELPRLTAQIASKLSELNKPNDGAAAAAITAQKALGTETVAVQQQTNASVLKQMDAMWAVRDKQAADALQKELDIERAFGSQRANASQTINKEIEAAWTQHEQRKQTISEQSEKEGEALLAAANEAHDKAISDALQKELEIRRTFAAEEVATAQSVEKDIAEAFAEREKDLTESADREAAAWEDHEQQKLNATKQAEKQGETIVAQSNAVREKAIKTSLANATRAASQSAAAQIRSQLQTAQAAVNSNSLIEKSLESLGDHLNLFIGHRIPIAGGAFIRLTENVRGFVTLSKETEGSVLRLGNIIADLSTKTGKSAPEIKDFLASFSKLGTQIEKDEAAVNAFGPALAQKLIPQLAAADSEMKALAASTAETGGAFAALSGPVGIAVLAVAAVVSVLALAEKQMFDVAEVSAKVEGRFIDLSQQVGLSTETLSAFDVLASTTGSDIGSLSASFVIFQKHLEDAQDPMSESAGLLDELGIQTTDTETALRQTFATLAKMPEGFRQTALAQQLFGRSGKSVLAIIKETNGDLDAAIKKFRDLIVSLEDAKAADKFNDELELLNRQVTDITVELGKEFLPAARDIVVTLGDLIKSSRGLFQIIGLFGKPLIEGFSQSLTKLSLSIAAVRHDSEETARILKDLADRRIIKPIEIPDLTPVPLPTGEESALKKAREEARLVKAEVSEAVRFAETQIAAIDRQVQERAVSPVEALEQIIAIEKQKTEAVIKGLEAQREARAKEFIKDERDRQKIADDLQAIDEQIANKRTEFDKFEADKRAGFRAQQLQREQQHRRALADLFLNALSDRIAAINRAAQAEINSQLFAQAVTTELLKAQFAKRKEILEKERAEAGKDPALAEQINAQLSDLQRERTATLAEQSERRLEILRAEQRKQLDLQRATIDSLLRASSIADSSRIATIRALAALQVKSEEQAAREILQIRLNALDREKSIAIEEREVIDRQITERLKGFAVERQKLEAELDKTGSISNTGVRVKEQLRLRAELQANVDAEIDAQKKANQDRTDADTELNNKLRVLNAERSQIQADGDRDIEEQRQQDLENAKRYNRELEEISARTADIEQETAREIIDLMEVHFARRRDIIRAQREFDLTEERLRHERVTESIRRQKSEVDEQIRILEIHLKSVKVGTHEEIDELEKLRLKLEELKQKREELRRQQEAEDQRNQTRKRKVTDTADRDERELDPLGKIKVSIEDLGRISDEIERSISGTADILKESILGVADALAQTVQNWILLGETGPAVGRKLLAQALANIAAEATANVIKETALGFAMLFLNPAEAAGHFTAAGLWALLAGGAALGGRAAAGDLFKQQKTSSSSGSRGSSSASGSNQRDPIDLVRSQLRERVIVLRVESNDSHIISVLENDVNRNGSSRDLIVRTAGG